jgi:hypothetical protein
MLHLTVFKLESVVPAWLFCWRCVFVASSDTFGMDCEVFVNFVFFVLLWWLRRLDVTWYFLVWAWDLDGLG